MGPIGGSSASAQVFTNQPTKSFDEYRKQYEENRSTESIPLEVQKQLLKHYEDQIKAHKDSIDYIDRNGIIPFMPPSVTQAIYEYYDYEGAVASLRDSIKRLSK